MRFTHWLALVKQNGARVHPLRWELAGTVTGLTLFNSTAGTVVDRIYGNRVAATELAGPPVFIVGHWRSGTTYLHELMS